MAFNCCSQTTNTTLTPNTYRVSGAYISPATYRSISVLAYSANVTVNGAAIEKDTTVSFSSNQNEIFGLDRGNTI